MEVDEAREITVTCGATEAMAAVLLAVIDPATRSWSSSRSTRTTARTRSCAVRSRSGCGWTPAPLDLDAVRSAVTPRDARHHDQHAEQSDGPRLHIRAELEGLAAICIQHDLIAITDEIYEHLVYEGRTCRSRHCRHARAHDHHQRRIEDVQRDRLAHRLDRCACSSQPPSGRCTTS
jgi:N-succinyldiaminopimelate aminotransferase